MPYMLFLSNMKMLLGMVKSVLDWKLLSVILWMNAFGWKNV